MKNRPLKTIKGIFLWTVVFLIVDLFSQQVLRYVDRFLVRHFWTRLWRETSSDQDVDASTSQTFSTDS